MESTLLDTRYARVCAQGTMVRQSDSGFRPIFGSDPELTMSES
jgi:hypothetical protein